MNTRLKCLLLDDELLGLSYLKMLCEQLPELEVVKAFNNPETFMKEVQRLEFDLCILDIEMPEINGLQVANLLNGKPVIFTTAYTEYAAEAFDLNAVDFVKKPVRIERLQQAVQKAIFRNQKLAPGTARQYVQLNTDQGKALLFFDQLCYVRVSDMDSRDKVACLAGGEIITLKNITFEKLIGMLPSNDFCRINKKELLALRCVQVFSFDEISINLKVPCLCW